MTKEEKFNDYEGFVEKFKPKKTTDDCYTPPKVYDAVVSFVNDCVLPLEGREIVRPFYPGGDFEHHAYPEGAVVIDNPPFSIYSKIVRFYLQRGIDFFLFSPQLSQCIPGADCCYIITNTDVTYENGAKVKTAFTTNLVPDLRLWLCPELKKRIEDAQRVETKLIGVNTYPLEFINSATAGRIIHRNVELKISRRDSVPVSNLDALRSVGKKVFGNGFLISERAAAERAAAERAAAERAAGSIVKLSEREIAIVKSLGI